MTSGWVSSHCPEEWVSLSRWLLTGDRPAGVTPPTLTQLHEPERFSVSPRVGTERALDFFFISKPPFVPHFQNSIFRFRMFNHHNSTALYVLKKTKILSPLFVFWQKKSFHGSAAPSTCLKMGALDLETAMMPKHPLWHHQGQIQYLHFFWSELKTTRGWLTDMRETLHRFEKLVWHWPWPFCNFGNKKLTGGNT